MRPAVVPLAGLLMLVPLLPAVPAEEELSWWQLPLGIPEPEAAPEATSLPPPPLVPGDDVVVPVVRNQDEFSIAANPLDPDNLVAGANDYSRGDAWAGVFTSFDGGLTWEHGYIPLPSIYTVSGDPAVAFDKDGHAYYIGIAFNRGGTNNGANGIFASKSTDGGRTWTTFIPYSSPSGAAFHDKPYVATDPNDGAVLLTYTHFGSGGGISFSRSLDGGLTWSARKVLGGGQFSLPVAGNNGEIYVTWTSAGAKFARSFDGGGTWQVTTPLGISLGSIPVPFRYFTYPVMDVARGGPHAGRIYLAGPQAGGAITGPTSPDLRVIVSDDQGATWSPPENIARPGFQFMPWMAIMPGGTVGIAYMDTVLSPNTWGPLSRVGDLLTDGTVLSQSLSVKGPGDAAWTTTLLTDLPSPADATGFWGDYQGLAATSKGFHPAFGDARESYLNGGQNADLPDFATMRVSPSLVVPVP